MLNAEKAVPEIDVQIGGKDYKFVFSVKALILAERETKTNVFKGDLIMNISLSQLVTLVWAGLQKHHPDVKREQIEDEITFQDVIKFKAAVSEGLERSAPPESEKKREEEDSSTS